MGNLIGGRRANGFVIDFETTTLSGSESKETQASYKACESLISNQEGLIALISDYKGCKELARIAMSTPTRENEQAAFEGLLLAVESIKQFFDYAMQLNDVACGLIQQLARAPLSENPALAVQLGKFLDFALQFDEMRMMQPNLSNDFSYYRRLLPKFYRHERVTIKDEDASSMAMFTAEHIPMLSQLTKAINRAQENLSSEGKERALAVQHMLASMANSCKQMLQSGKYKGKERTALLTARSMTGALVLYDLLGPTSVFSKRSLVATRDCIVVLKAEFPQQFGLFNAIKYSTKTFSNAPNSIQDLFE